MPTIERWPRAGDRIEDFCRACKTDRMHTVVAADPDGVPIRVVVRLLPERAQLSRRARASAGDAGRRARTAESGPARRAARAIAIATRFPSSASAKGRRLR